MGEKVQVAAKKPEVKRENQASKSRNADQSQSMSSPVDQVLYLQRTIGNQAVQKLARSGALQAKLKIGQPRDKYEQEADRVADAMMRTAEPGLQRKVGEEEELLQTKALFEQITPLVQRQEAEEEFLQAKELTGHNAEIIPDLESRIHTMRSGGQPLPESVHAYFEPRLGRDFSHVRIHTDDQAANAAREIPTSAFTVGKNIAFAPNHFASNTDPGQRHIAHELSHSLQQSYSPSSTLQCRRTREEAREERMSHRDTHSRRSSSTSDVPYATAAEASLHDREVRRQIHFRRTSGRPQAIMPPRPVVPDLAEFGPGDEPVVLSSLQRTGNSAIEAETARLEASPLEYTLDPAPRTAPAVRRAAIQSAEVPVLQAASGRIPSADESPTPQQAQPPSLPPAPRFEASDNGTVGTVAVDQARSAVSALPTADAGAVPPPAAPPTFELVGAVDPERVAEDGAAVTAEFYRQHAAGGEQIDAPQGEDELYPEREPIRVEAPIEASVVEAPPATVAAGNVVPAEDEALIAARRAWAAELSPHIELAHEELAESLAQNQLAEGEARAVHEAQLSDQVNTGTAQQDQLRQQAWTAIAHLRGSARSDLSVAAADGREQIAAEMVRTDMALYEAKVSGDAEAALRLQQEHMDAQVIAREAERTARHEKNRSMAESSSWFGAALDVVRSAMQRVRNSISAIWNRARATIANVLNRARELARRAIERAVQIAFRAMQHFSNLLANIVRQVLRRIWEIIQRTLRAIADLILRLLNRIRVLLQTLVDTIRDFLNRLAVLLSHLIARLREAINAIIAHIRALIRYILRRRHVVIGPIEVFSRISVSGRPLAHLSTGDMPWITIEPIPIPTQVGVFIVYGTQRADADFAFLGGGLGPGTIERLELLVDPLASTYMGSGTIAIAADAAAGGMLTGIFSGNASWMGIAGLRVEGGPQIVFRLLASGARRSVAEVEYRRGTVTLKRADDAELCLEGTASAYKFLRIKAFTGLPWHPPRIGPGKPARCGPCCKTCRIADDPSVLPYRDLVLLENWWNAENYALARCWRWRLNVAALANRSGVAGAFDAELDTSSIPKLLNDLHAASRLRSVPTAAARAIATDGQEERKDCGDCQPNHVGKSFTIKPDCKIGKHPDHRYYPRPNKVQIKSGTKHTRLVKPTKSTCPCTVDYLQSVVNDPPENYNEGLERWIRAVQVGDHIEYGSQMGSDTFDNYVNIVKEIICNNDNFVNPANNWWWAETSHLVGIDISEANEPKITYNAQINSAPNRAHLIPKKDRT